MNAFVALSGSTGPAKPRAMWWALFAAAPLAFALLCGVGANAQVPTSTAEIRPNYHKDAQSDGVQELKRINACVYKRNAGYAEELLRARPGSSDEVRMFEAVRRIIPECMRRYNPAISIGGLQERGALAEQIYLAEHPDDPDFARFDRQPIGLPDGWLVEGLSKSDHVALFQQQFGNCVVKADPVDAAAMLRTEPATAAEIAVVQRLVPYLGPCLDEGMTFTLDSAILRALVAEALVRGVRTWKPLEIPAVEQAPEAAE